MENRREKRWRKWGIHGVLLLLPLLFAIRLGAQGTASHKSTKQSSAKRGLQVIGPSGADQILSSIYDPSTNSIRVSGGSGSSSGGTVTSVGLSMPNEFSVTGSPISSSGTLTVNWTAPLSIAHGGTGQVSPAAAFNALAPPTSLGGLIYGTGPNTYGNLSPGANGQCLESNGTSIAWAACGSGNGFTASGDLDGTSTAQTVVGLQGHPLSGAAPATNQVLQWNGTAWTPTSLTGTGTVTSVGLSLPPLFTISGSPVTSAGTLSATLASQNANYVFAGPASGTAAAPAFRPLVGADVPAINLTASGTGGVSGILGITNGGTGQSSAAAAFNSLAPPTTPGGLIYGTGTNTYGNLSLGSGGQCLQSNGTAPVWGPCGSGFTAGGDLTGTSASQKVTGLQGRPLSAAAPAAGQLLQWSGAAWAPATLPAGGTVTSVSLSLPSIFNVTGSPVTTSGTLLASMANESANTIMAGPASGTPGTPVFRSLTNSDIPAIDLTTSGNGGVAGALGVANGGTGLTSAGAAGQCLTSNGTSMVWGACGSGSGSGTGLPSTWSVNGTTNATTIAPVSGQDATPLTVLQSNVTSPSADVFDICSSAGCTSGTKYFWIGPSGSIGWSANAGALGSANQTEASYWRLYGGIGANAYDQFLSASLPTPGQPAPATATTGGSIAAATYKFSIAYLAGPSNQYSTAGSTPGQITTTGSTSTITIPSPPALAGATGWKLYEYDNSQGQWVLEGTYTAFTNVTLTTITHPVTAIPPTTNNTGAQFNTYISAAAGTNGVACVSGTVPGYDCAPGTMILTQNSLVAGSNITLTPASDGTVTIASTGGGGSANAVVTNPSATQTITNPGSGELDVKSSGGSTVAQIGVGGTTVTSFASLKSNSSLVVDNNGTGSFLNLAADKDQIWNGFGTENTDVRGTISVTAATSQSATFPLAYAHAPVCVITPTSNPGSLGWWVTTSTTAVTANLSASGTVAFNYVCIGANN
ncbi:MAG TPA: hypothetical protein VFZ08_04930 [Terriglobia bacterium]|nr:hypothetical protein [Terriglobia bacterium]